MCSTFFFFFYGFQCLQNNFHPINKNFFKWLWAAHISIKILLGTAHSFWDIIQGDWRRNGETFRMCSTSKTKERS